MVLSWDTELLHLLVGEAFPAPPWYGGMGALEALTHGRTLSSTRLGAVTLST